MGKVNIQIHNRSYPMECDDGQETHIENMASEIDIKIRDVAKSVGNIGDIRLMVMTSILMADEIHELKKQNKELTQKIKFKPKNDAQNYEEVFATAIEKVAKKIEALAEKVKKN